MVAADNHQAAETAAAAKALRALAPTVGPIAEADAHLVNADLEFEGMQEESGNVEARAAVAGYSPYCDSGDAAMAAQCDPHNWFYALMFAGYGAQGERNSAAAAIYLHMALDAAVQAGERGLEIKATAILASLAQADNDTELAQRLLVRAKELSRQHGDPALRGYVASFEGDVMDSREQYAASLAAYRDGIAISHAAGLARREAQYEISASGEHLRLGQPAESLATLERAGTFLATHNEPGMERTRLHDQTIALLALGRTAEAQAKLREVLARYDRETGPNARIGMLRDLAPALARAGDRAGAIGLYTREQKLLQAKNDSRYDRDMQERAASHQDRERRAAVAPRRRVGQRGGGGRAARAGHRVRRPPAGHAQSPAGQPQRPAADAGGARPAHRPGQPRPPAGARGGPRRRALRGRAVPDRRRLVSRHINDRFGHAAGDAVLQEIARRLEGVLR